MSIKTPRMSDDGEYIAPLEDRIGQIYDLLMEQVNAVLPSFLKWDEFDKSGRNLRYHKLSSEVGKNVEAIDRLLEEIKTRGKTISTIKYSLLKERIEEHKKRIDLSGWLPYKIKEITSLHETMKIVADIDFQLHTYTSLKGSDWGAKIILDVHIGLSFSLSQMSRHFHKLKTHIDKDLR